MSNTLNREVRSYIMKCSEVIESNDQKEADALCDTIIHVFAKYVDGITSGLESYSFAIKGEPNHIKDLRLLKSKLELLAAEVYDGLIPSDKKAGFTINANSSANNSSSNTITNNVNIKADIEIMVKDTINEIENNGSLTSEQIDEIVNKIIEIKEVAIADDTRPNKWKKLKGCLDWLATNGVDVAVKILPIILAAISKQ